VGEPASIAPATLPRSEVSTAAMALIKSIGTVAVTVFVFGIVVWWLIVVLSKIGIAPTVNSKGAVTVDQYQRAKDILQVFFPLATAALGCWFGNRGTAKAQDRRNSAEPGSCCAQCLNRQ
jgi:hypothetical protein